MITQELQKVKEELKGLRREFAGVRFLLSALLVEDKDGQYKKSFVKKIKKALKERPVFVYEDKKSFLASLRK